MPSRRRPWSSPPAGTRVDALRRRVSIDVAPSLRQPCARMAVILPCALTFPRRLCWLFVAQGARVVLLGGVDVVACVVVARRATADATRGERRGRAAQRRGTARHAAHEPRKCVDRACESEGHADVLTPPVLWPTQAARRRATLQSSCTRCRTWTPRWCCARPAVGMILPHVDSRRTCMPPAQIGRVLGEPDERSLLVLQEYANGTLSVPLAVPASPSPD